MKYIVVFFLFMLMSVGVSAQETDLPKRNISLIILDKKNRPIERIIVRSLNNTNAGMTNRKGLFVFTDMTDDDMISMLLPKYGETIVPVTGMDSIVVKLRSARRYSYVNNEGQSVVIDREKVEPKDVIDAQALLSRNHYSSLIDLLQGANVAGLSIDGTNIRGQSSLHNNDPLVVIDGMQISGGLGKANSIVNVRDIKTIEIQKGINDMGTRGRNGVIVITTIK